MAGKGKGERRRIKGIINNAMTNTGKQAPLRRPVPMKMGTQQYGPR